MIRKYWRCREEADELGQNGRRLFASQAANKHIFFGLIYIRTRSYNHIQALATHPICSKVWGQEAVSPLPHLIPLILSFAQRAGISL